MSKDMKSLIDMNPCGTCRASELPFCKCSGPGGGGNGKDAKNDRENAYKTQLGSGVAAQKENNPGLVGPPNKPIFAFETGQKQEPTDQQEKVALQPTPFSIKPAPAPSVKKVDDEQQKEAKADNVGVSTENKPFHPTPFSMTLELNPYRR